MKDKPQNKTQKPEMQPFSKEPEKKLHQKPLNVIDTEEGERIAKRLARAGIASRRDAESMIASGRIAVNGKVLNTPAFNVAKTDVITVDGKPLQPTERTRLWLYHKPAGLVTTNRDPEGRPTVFENLPEDLPRVLSVGRLDINTEGLLLLTNDGGLARVLELPATGWVRRYRVRAHGKVTQADLDNLKNGIAIDGVFYGAIEAQFEREQGSNVWLNIALREGKNREVKNILGALGLVVARLIRVSFGPFQLGELEEGMVKEIKGRTLRDQLGERLIEEANADFDAPIIKPFSNIPVKADKVATEENDWVSSSPRSHNAKSEEPRERQEPRSRSANVWMGPGARPHKARFDGGRADPGERPYHRNNREDEEQGERRSFGDRPRKPREEGERRSFGDRPYKPREEGERRSFGDRPYKPREEGERRPFGDRPYKPREEGERRSFGDRPRKPREEGERRSFGDRPYKPREEGERRSFGDRPRKPREEGERRSFGDRPRKPREEGERRSFGDRPRKPREDGDKRAGRPVRGKNNADRRR